MTSIEQQIIDRYIGGTTLSAVCQENLEWRMRIVRALPQRADIPRGHFDLIIEQRLVEAMTSPVDWIRERAHQVASGGD